MWYNIGLMEAATPMLKQYLQIKSQHKDCILFFRLGDFYEMFYEDAKAAASLLDLVLTSRGSDGTGKIPMCGIPYHSAENYVAKLVKAGHKVAICEQTEDPSVAKGIVRRDVIRVVSAGTFIDDTADTRYIASIYPSGSAFGVALSDTATGIIHTNIFVNSSAAIEVLSKFTVHECVYPEDEEVPLRELLGHPFLKLRGVMMTRFSAQAFDPSRAYRGLCAHFGVNSLRGFGLEDKPAAHAAAGALLEYLKDMYKKPLKHVDRLTLYDDSEHVFLSPAAHHGLEMEMLLKTLDHTLTPMGRRMFRFWMYHPLKDVALIHARQRALLALKNEDRICEVLQASLLCHIPDIEKSLSRLSCGSAAPRDLLVVRNVLERLPFFAQALAPLADKEVAFLFRDIPALREKLLAAVDPQMPLAKNEGKVIRAGFSVELDELRGLRENGLGWLKEFQAREIKRTGINSLKVGFNRVFGYYIEITSVNIKSAPADYIRKQTLANGERYITEELKEYEGKILSAEARILKIEADIVGELTRDILREMSFIHAYARQIAEVDALLCLVLISRQRGYVMPAISEGYELLIEDGRHPVVEALLPGEFVANDTHLDRDEEHLMILTGPNMAGKSTYIRQNAVLVIMAQVGSFVPARVMKLGIVDKIFTRIGAHDEIAKGQSTFMVEMNETADILNNLSARSLVILDEVGRGTSTYDGLSLAWALAEHLAQQKARTLFATHFHELTLLADQFPGVKNYNVAVKEWEDRVIFLHKIIPGGTDDSYGIYVAKLAGLPELVIRRAKEVLAILEFGSSFRERLKGQTAPEEQLDMFKAGRTSDPVLEEIRVALEALDVNHLTPVQALQTLNEFKKMV